MNPICLSIKQEETGKRIKQLLQDHGYKVKDIQGAMGFETPQAVYKAVGQVASKPGQLRDPEQIAEYKH